MIPKRIELENFLSFGKPAVEFTFTDEEPLWALCGQNGIGKSAVFDGITYALYGEHRGGSHKAEQLIRHGANGFRLVFEFEFAGIDYRITRARAGKTTQKVECRIDEVWESVAGVNSAVEVKNWVEKPLALGYKAFTTSVLLRQGEADKLFSASREERIAVLKGIIGFERFEEVSDRVHAATQCRATSFNTLRLQIDSLLPVTTEELANAAEELTSSETTCGLARSNVTAAAQRVEKAKQWESLESKRISLEQVLTAAANRAEESATIRSEKARLDELTVAVVELETLFALREGIKALSPKILQAGLTRDQTSVAIELSIQSAVTSRHDEACHKEQSAEFYRKAKSLGDEIERGDNLLKLADAMEEIRAKLAAYPPDLADQVSKAEVAAEYANQEKQHVSENLAAAQAILKQAKEHQDRFAKVGVGVTCFHCGQLVDEVHARAERDRLTTEVQTREAEVERLRLTFAGLNTKSTDARERLVLLKNTKVESDNLSTRLGATRESLTQLGEAATAAELRPRIIDQRKEKTAAEAASAEEKAKQDETRKKADKLELERLQLDKKLKAEEEAVRKLEMKLSGDTAAFNLGLVRLTPDWQSRLPMLDAEEVGELASERNRLQAAGVNARFESLRQDEEKRDDWTKQLGEVSAEIEGVSSDARVPAKEAERLLKGSKETEKAANEARDAALRSRDELLTLRWPNSGREREGPTRSRATGSASDRP